MRTIGLIGGMSWHSTREYYRIINSAVADSRGGLNSANVILHSLNFQDVATLTDAEEWRGAADILVSSAKILRQAGADFGALCVNTMHKVAGIVEAESGLRLIHIIDVVVESIRNRGVSTVGLLGNKFITEDGFYYDRLNNYGVEVILPHAEDREFLHRVIYSELSQGRPSIRTRERCLQIVSDLVDRGAQGIVMACTELPSVLSPEDCRASLFDTALIHAHSIAMHALELDTQLSSCVASASVEASS